MYSEIDRYNDDLENVTVDIETVHLNYHINEVGSESENKVHNYRESNHETCWCIQHWYTCVMNS